VARNAKAQLAKAQQENLVHHLLTRIRQLNLPDPELEYRFAPGRQFRADLAWLHHGLLVELEGGTWIYGRHNRASGFEADCEKYNLATQLGWRVLRFTSNMVEDDRAVYAIETFFKLKEEWG
jgi:very-short-patch-repair endonuclease